MPVAPEIDTAAIKSYEPSQITGDGVSAAVSIPILYRSETPHLIFIKRADSLDRHPGQMAFPGGRREPDESLIDTARREAREEIGLLPREYHLLGRIDDIQTVTEFIISPFVVSVPDREYHPTSVEVADVCIVPLARLLDPSHYRYEQQTAPDGTSIDVHYFDIGNQTVWGATGQILTQFLQIASDWSVPSDKPSLEG